MSTRLSTGNSITPTSLTKVDDTNVTLTLGGSPTTALLQATSLTLGWTGTLADSRIASATTWNAKQAPFTILSTLGGLANASGVLTNNGAGVLSWGAAGGSQTPWTSNINAAGYTLFGNSISGGTLTLSSTSHATKGKILFGTSAYDEVNNRLGINTTTPLHGLDVKSDTPYNRILGNAGTGLLIGSFSSSEGAIWDGAVTPTYTNYLFLTSSGHTLFNAAIDIRFRTNNTTKMSISDAGKVGIGIGDSSPSAFLHLPAGTATANTAPLKLTAGTNLTTPENGTFEYDGTNLYFTVGGVRKTIQLL